MCDYDAYVFCSLPLVRFFFFFFFACLFLFLLLIWHHERGLGLLTGITDSGAPFFFLFSFLSLLFINIMASVASLYMYA